MVGTRGGAGERGGAPGGEAGVGVGDGAEAMRLGAGGAGIRGGAGLGAGPGGEAPGQAGRADGWCVGRGGR